MNAKKAKKIRQLVRHLQNKGLVGKDGWEVYNDQPIVRNLVINDTSTPAEIGFSRKLDLDCSKAVYKSMKKNARNSTA
jgi:hypothetical protein